MKIFAALVLLSGLPLLVSAQEEVTARTGTAATTPAAPLAGTWVAKRVEGRSGAAVMSDDEVQKSDLVFVFDAKRLTLYTQGRKTSVTYTTDGQYIRTGGGTAYQIEKITLVELTLTELTTDASGSRLKIYLARSEGTYENYMFRKYVVPNLRFDGDTFYVMNEYVFPKFQGRGSNETFFDSYQNSYEFIEDAFRQQGKPKRDRFRVSFMVSKTGKVENPTIVESTDPRYDEALLRAMRATSALWTPATANSRPARVQINYEFPYGLPEDRQLTLPEILQLKAKDLVQEALRNFQRKRYAEALTTFNQALALEPGNLSIRLNRAATYYQLGQLDNACAEWRYLSALGDKTAARYVRRYCK
ncbi:MAG: TonB family protein [Sphingobacteriaceae bacterium]|nr:TonB family protein [Cytophagaceae bacterium]